MKLIANVDSPKIFNITFVKGMEYDFQPGGGGGLFCTELGLGLTDPCLAVFAFRLQHSPAPDLEAATALCQQYADSILENDDASGLLGVTFNVLCWSPISGEFSLNRIYEVEIVDEFGSGTDGFVSKDGYTVDTVVEALEHFVVAAY